MCLYWLVNFNYLRILWGYITNSYATQGKVLKDLLMFAVFTCTRDAQNVMESSIFSIHKGLIIWTRLAPVKTGLTRIFCSLLWLKNLGELKSKGIATLGNMKLTLKLCETFCCGQEEIFRDLNLPGLVGLARLIWTAPYSCVVWMLVNASFWTTQICSCVQVTYNRWGFLQIDRVNSFCKQNAVL